MHVWTLNGQKNVASIHVSLAESVDNEKFMDIAAKIEEFFHKYEVHSVTIQPEFTSPSLKRQLEKYSEFDVHFCHLNCSNDCVGNWCCQPAPKKNSKKKPQKEEKKKVQNE